MEKSTARGEARRTVKGFCGERERASVAAVVVVVVVVVVVAVVAGKAASGAAAVSFAAAAWLPSLPPSPAESSIAASPSELR